MPQTATSKKPETTGHVSVLAKLMQSLAEVDLTTYAPEEPTKCSHYVELGVVENDETRRMVALRLSLIADYNAKAKVLNAEGKKKDEQDQAVVRELEETAFLVETLTSAIRFDVNQMFDLSDLDVALDFGPGWVLSYTDHSPENFFKDLFGEDGPFGKIGEGGLPEGFEKLFGALFGEADDAPKGGLLDALRRAGVRVEVMRSGERRRPSIFDLLRR